MTEIKKLGGTVTVDELRTGDTWVDLGGTSVTDAKLAHINRFTKLRSLSLICTKVGDAGLEHVKGLAGLRRLDLGGTNITDAGMKNIKRNSRNYNT